VTFNVTRSYCDTLRHHPQTSHVLSVSMATTAPCCLATVAVVTTLNGGRCGWRWAAPDWLENEWWVVLPGDSPCPLSLYCSPTVYQHYNHGHCQQQLFKKPSSKLRHFKSDRNEIWQDCSSSKYTLTGGQYTYSFFHICRTISEWKTITGCSIQTI